MNLDNIRTWQLNHMKKVLDSIQIITKMYTPEDLCTYRDSGDGWTVLEVICHLRDFEEIFFQRAKQTVEQNRPDLPFPHPDELAKEKQYNQQNIEQVMDEWQQIRGDYIAFLEKRAESDWERIANHPTRGDFTLHDQVFLIAWHDTNHMEQILRIVQEKQTSASTG